ncbi:MAG: hypothetical protein FD120_2817, partial [Gammaproteobacteria bacterium]
ETLIVLPNSYLPCPAAEGTAIPATTRAAHGLPEEAVVFASVLTHL